MDFEHVISNRHTTRAFTEQSIPLDTLRHIVHLAQQAPSWVNSQPVRVYIATGETLEKMRRQHSQLNHDHTDINPVIPFRPKNQWDQASQENMEGWFESNIEQVGIDWSTLSHDNANDLYNAQAAIYLTLPENYSDWSLIDTGMLSQNIMLAALNEGLGSIPAFEFVKYVDHLRTNLHLPSNEAPVMGIGLGYIDDAAAINKIRADRMDTNQMLTILE